MCNKCILREFSFNIRKVTWKEKVGRLSAAYASRARQSFWLVCMFYAGTTSLFFQLSPWWESVWLFSRLLQVTSEPHVSDITAYLTREFFSATICKIAPMQIASIEKVTINFSHHFGRYFTVHHITHHPPAPTSASFRL